MRRRFRKSPRTNFGDEVGRDIETGHPLVRRPERGRKYARRAWKPGWKTDPDRVLGAGPPREGK
jgi:hypothetical protein